MAKKRKVGDIFLELEILIDELIEDHEFQWGDILYWILGHLKIHRPDAQEEYLDGTNPEFQYGPKRDVSKGSK